MRSLVGTIAPVGFCLFLPLLGCTGVGPHNWARIEQPYHASKSPVTFRRSPLLADAQHEMPLEPSPANRMLARGRIREHWNRARSYEQAGETEQAAAHYQEILRLEPRYAPAHHRLGVLATMWGRFGDADQHFRLARMVNKPQPSEEELYAAKSAASEREAEQQLQQEIAAEKRQAEALAEKQKAYTRQSLPAAEDGQQMDAESYYAQSERPLQQLRTAVRRRTSEWMAPINSRVASRSESYEDSSPEETRTARSRIVRDGEQRYDPDEHESYYDEPEVEAQEGPVYRKAAREPEPAVRRTSTPVRSAQRPDAYRSSEYRSNRLREDSLSAHYMAGAEERERDIYDPKSEHAEVTSGYRRRTSHESDRFEEELPARTLASRPEPRQSLPDKWEAEARVEKQATVVQTKATMPEVTARDQAIAHRAAEIEATVKENVQRQVSDSLAERRIDLARQQLHRAQQQLVEAMVAAEESEQSSTTRASQPVEQQTHPVQPSRTRLPLPAPRRWRGNPSAALETEAGNELAELDEEESFIQPDPVKQLTREIIHAAANAPAMAGEVDPSEIMDSVSHNESASSNVIQTSHAEEVVEELEETVTDSLEELYAAARREAERESACQKTESSLPQTRAHQPERSVHSLDETTLHRRSIEPRSSFQKKAPEAAEMMLYR